MRIYEVHYSGISEPFETGAQSLPQKSIAVLPFVNMSSEAEQDYFYVRISEEIINSLVQLNNLRVVARTSVFSFKGKNYDLREIGRMLDVSTLLEGKCTEVRQPYTNYYQISRWS